MATSKARVVIVLLLVIALAAADATPARAVPYECRTPAYAQAHPDECGDSGNPFLLGGGGGGGNSGGLIGSILHHLGL